MKKSTNALIRKVFVIYGKDKFKISYGKGDQFY